MTISERTTRTTSQRRKASTGVVLLLGLLAGLVGLAPSAFAHHPEISGSSGCAEGLPVVNYTAKSWAPRQLEGYHPSVTAQYRLTTSGAWTDLETSNFQPGHDEFSGSRSFPVGTTTVYLQVKVSTAQWGDWYDADPYSAYGYGGGDVWPGGAGIRVDLNSDCTTPPAPGGTISWTCGSDVSIALTNSGQESIDAAIFRNGSSVKTVVVPPGGSTTTISPTGENTIMVISVEFADEGSSTDLANEFTVDCDYPAPAIAEPVCQATGGLDVALGNLEGTDTATFTIVIDGQETSTTVAAGATKVINIPVAEDATVSLSISSGEATYENAALTRDCQEPAATVVFTCAAGGVVVSLTNSGSEAATVNVNDEPVNVPANTTADDPVIRTIPVAEGAEYDITVLGVTASGTRDCENPAIGPVQIECAEGGVVVVLTNDGLLDSTVTVDGVEVTVPAGTTGEDPVRVTVPVDENGAYDFRVSGDGLDQRLTGTLDCLFPEPTVDGGLACAKGGLSVVLRNPGDDTAEFTVTSPVLPDGETTTSVEAGGTESVFIPLAESATTDVTVTSDDEVLLDETVTRDCETVLPGIVTTTSISGPTSLPRTGSDSSSLFALAGGLLLMGLVLVAGSRRKAIEGK